jgi:hypothetical protein
MIVVGASRPPRVGQPVASSPGDPAVRAFVDLSNIWYGMTDAAAAHGESGLPVRLSADNIAVLLRAGRADFRELVVANADVPDPIIDRFGRVAEVLRRESGRITGTEQANDETLQVRMYETMHNNAAGVIALATGDGAGWREGRGFLSVLEAARRHKWGIEVVAWGGSANHHLMAWVRSVGEVFIDLNDYYMAVTFVQGGRQAQSLSLRHRPTAAVRATRLR